MERLYKILEEAKPGVDFKTETALISDGVLDSFDIITIVNMIMEEFDCEIDLADLEPENMDSAEAMWEMIQG